MAEHTARPGHERDARVARRWGLIPAMHVCLLALAPCSALGVGAGPSRDYMTVTLNLTQQSFVRVAFTGYAYAKSSASGTITPG